MPAKSVAPLIAIVPAEIALFNCAKLIVYNDLSAYAFRLLIYCCFCESNNLVSIDVFALLYAALTKALVVAELILFNPVL